MVVTLGADPVYTGSILSSLLKKAKKKGKKALQEGEFTISKGGVSFAQKQPAPAPGAMPPAAGPLDVLTKNPLALAGIAGGGLLLLLFLSRRKRG